MKILIINNGYLTFGVSGGDKHLLDVGEALSREHDVTMIMPDFVATLPAQRIRRRTYRAWPPRSVPSIICAYGLRCLQACLIAWREKADVVLASSGPVDILPALANRARYASCVAVYPFHLVHRRQASTWVKRFQFAVSRLAQHLALRLMQRADVVFTDNGLVAAELAAHGIPPERIHVQRPAVNVEQVQAAPVIRKYQVMFIGRMVRSKGIYDLVDALRDVPVSAGLVGDGEELSALKEYVNKCGAGERIHILGPRPFAEMYALLKGCELFVFPSYEEGYGIAIAEAIAANVPVLAYDLPHYHEVFNSSLITVPVGDVAALAAQLHDFFAGRIDIASLREKYRAVVLASKESAAAFELSIIKATCGKKPQEASAP